MLRQSLFAEIKYIRHVISRAQSQCTQQHWDIFTGVCVERLPVVTPPLNDLQKKYKDLLNTIEIENSMKSDHEIRDANDRIQAELLKNESIEVDIDAVSKITAQDFEDSANEELEKFKCADITTDADKKNDRTSTERCLQQHLVLVTDVKLGKDTKTILPQGIWKEGETLRQTAERVLAESCGSDMKVQFLGNAPCGFYKYKYPSEINGKVGAKVFFYYANHKAGNVPKGKSKVQWLNRKELESALPNRYKTSVTEFLIEENY